MANRRDGARPKARPPGAKGKKPGAPQGRRRDRPKTGEKGAGRKRAYGRPHGKGDKRPAAKGKKPGPPQGRRSDRPKTDRKEVGRKRTYGRPPGKGDIRPVAKGKKPGPPQGRHRDRPKAGEKSGVRKRTYGRPPPGKDGRRPVAKARKPARPRDDSLKVQKVIAASGLASRRKAEDLVKEGKVRVDGQVASLGTRVHVDAQIMVDGKVLTTEPEADTRLIAYNKPRGQIVSRDGLDQVFDHLPELRHGRWVNVGRLDVDSEGLLLFTNDGDLANALAHPSSGLHREYVVRAKQAIDDGTLETAVAKGVSILGETVRPIHLARRHRREASNNWYEIVLDQGRNRVVRRLFDCLGAKVNRLIRVRFGEFDLPRNLEPGQWREVKLPEDFLAKGFSMKNT